MKLSFLSTAVLLVASFLLQVNATAQTKPKAVKTAEPAAQMQKADDVMVQPSAAPQKVELIEVPLTPTVATTPKIDSAPKSDAMPKMNFKEKTFDFGKVKTGDKPTHTFEFENTGNADLDISLVSGCDCTEIEWTTTTVKPGERGFVKATFNTTRAEPEDHKKPLKKDMTIILKQTYPKNDYPIIEELFFTVEITD
jgi:Protein of unknown function (DUF1573)